MLSCFILYVKGYMWYKILKYNYINNIITNNASDNNYCIINYSQ